MQYLFCPLAFAWLGFCGFLNSTNDSASCFTSSAFFCPLPHQLPTPFALVGVREKKLGFSLENLQQAVKRQSSGRDAYMSIAPKIIIHHTLVAFFFPFDAFAIAPLLAD